MSGVRKLIYIPNEKIWEEIQRSAKGNGRSASNYLITLHMANITKKLQEKPLENKPKKPKLARQNVIKVMKKKIHSVTSKTERGSGEFSQPGLYGGGSYPKDTQLKKKGKQDGHR